MLRFALVFLILNSATLAIRGNEAPSFVGDIAPILVRHCVACHGPKNPQGEYQLHTWKRANMLARVAKLRWSQAKPSKANGSD